MTSNRPSDSSKGGLLRPLLVVGVSVGFAALAYWRYARAQQRPDQPQLDFKGKESRPATHQKPVDYKVTDTPPVAQPQKHVERSVTPVAEVSHNKSAPDAPSSDHSRTLSGTMRDFHMYDGESFIHSSGGRATPIDSLSDASRTGPAHSHPKKAIYRTFEMLCVSEEAELSSLIKKLGTYLSDKSNLPVARGDDSTPASAIDMNLRASIQAWFARVVQDAMSIKGKVVEKVVQQERAVLEGTVHSSLASPEDEDAAEERPPPAGHGRPTLMSENAQGIEGMVSSLTVSSLLGRASHASVEAIVGDLAVALSECNGDHTAVERLLSPFSAGSAFVVGKSLLVRDLTLSPLADDQRRFCSLLFLARAAHLLSTSCIASEGNGVDKSGDDERILYTSAEKADDFFGPELFFYLSSVLLSYLQLCDDVLEQQDEQHHQVNGSPSAFQRNSLVNQLNAICAHVPNPSEEEAGTLIEDLMHLRTRVQSRVSQVILSGLHRSQGNHAGCWMQLSSALARPSGGSDEDQQEVGSPSMSFGDRDLDELDCLVEAIRCGGGFEGCDGASPRVGEAWLNLALSFHPTESATVAIPRHAIPYKLYSSALKVSPTRRGSFPGVAVVAVDRKTCLGKALCNSENQKEAYLWLELARSLKLEISSTATEIPSTSSPQEEEAPCRLRLLCRPIEEKVTVKMEGRPSTVTRVTALTYALALEPHNVDAWLRLAQSVEDESTVRWRLAGDAIQLAREKSIVLREDIHPNAVDIVVDPAVYTRVLFPSSDDDSGFCVGKMEALLSCLKYEAQALTEVKDRNHRVWLSIGTTLAERQLMERRVQQLRRHSGHTDLLPETPSFTTPICSTTEEKPFTVRLPKSLLPGEPNRTTNPTPSAHDVDHTEGDGLIVVNADLAFQMAATLSGRIRGTIQQWCEAKGYPTPEWM